MLKTNVLFNGEPTTTFTEAFPTLASYQDALHFLDNSSLFPASRFTTYTLRYRGKLVGASHFPAALINKLVIGQGIFQQPTLTEQRWNRNRTAEYLSYILLLLPDHYSLPNNGSHYKNEIASMSGLLVEDISLSSTFVLKYGYTDIPTGFWDKPVVKWVGSRDRAIAGMFKNAQAAYAEWEREKVEGSWSRKPYSGNAVMTSDFEGSYSWLGKYLRAKNTGFATDTPVRKVVLD